MVDSVRESAFGVDVFVGDRCFVLYSDVPARTAVVESISETGEIITVALDDGSKITVGPDRLTLSFELHWQNQRRRGA